MRKLKRIEYWTMNSWNGVKAPAYNLKVYNVIKPELQDAAYTILSDENLARYLFDDINYLIDEFTEATKYAYTAGFNGRSGGYLVLYKSCRETEYNKDGKPYSRLKTYVGQDIDAKDVPGNVKRLFKKLALDIIKTAEYFCKKPIENETITIEKQIKTFGEL